VFAAKMQNKVHIRAKNQSSKSRGCPVFSRMLRTFFFMSRSFDGESIP